MTQRHPNITVPADVLANWQEIVNLLAQLTGVSAALLMRLKQDDIEVYLASDSGGNPFRPGDTSRLENSGLYCEAVLKSGEKLRVPDARADDAWKTNPDVKLGMVSYLGFPLYLPNKTPYGTLCILDSKRNGHSTLVEALMLKFKRIIEYELELVYMNQVLGSRNGKLSDYLTEIQALRGMVSICSGCKAVRDKHGQWHPIEHYLIKHPEAEFTHGLCPVCMRRLYPDLTVDADTTP